MKWLGVLLITLLAAGCSGPATSPLSGPPAREMHRSPYGILTSDRWNYGATYQRRDLTPVANPNRYAFPQPERDRPHGVAVTPDGAKAYVALPGMDEAPGNQVAVVDLETGKVLRRLQVGLSPRHLTLHPDGRFLVVLNRFSNYASVIDTELDSVVEEIPLDFYAAALVFTRNGRQAFASIRYLDQVLVLDVEATGKKFQARVRPLGGFAEKEFLGGPPGENLNAGLRLSCGTAFCHGSPRGGFVAGPDPVENFLSAVENSRPGDPDESLLLRAVLSTGEGGFANDFGGANMHAGGKVALRRADPLYHRLSSWIARARSGPGISVGNPGSRPGPLALDPDERYLFVGNQGTQDLSIIDLHTLEEVSGIYLQNIVRDLAISADPKTGRRLLVVATQGVGFGAPREPDPYGAETENRNHPLAQFTILRDLETTEPLPLARQHVAGPFDAVDGTAAFKMRDIQNDLVVIDLARLEIPLPRGPGRLQYALAPNRYQAHRDWVRYTSDSAEALHDDVRGDIPPELMRVIGAAPEALAVEGNDLYVAMEGSAEVVRYRLHPAASEPSDVLEPVQVWPVGLGPRALAFAGGRMVATAALGETMTILPREGKGRTITVGNLSRPYPDSDAERGELFVVTAHFSADGDTSCTSCHLYGMGDGRGWAAGQAMVQFADGRLAGGGLLAIPQLRNLWDIQPFYFEGTHTAYEGQFDDAMEQLPLGAFRGITPQGDFRHLFSPLPPEKRPPLHEEIQEKMILKPWGADFFDLKERRDAFVRRRSQELSGKAFRFRDYQRFIGEYQAVRAGIVPNPFDARNPSVARGRGLFHSLATGCGVCHVPPSFTNKSEKLAPNREATLPGLVTFTRREKSFTLISPHSVDRINRVTRDLEPWEAGRAQREQGRLTTFQLRGIFDRPASFLHNGMALTLRESVMTPDHYSLEPFRYQPLTGGQPVRPQGREQGFNAIHIADEAGSILDSHGGTSHLTAREARDLINFMLAIE